MTGQVSYVDSLFLPLSPQRGYTIDSFSETSTVAVCRTTPTRVEVDDEELFRDLFGSEPEPRADNFGGLLSPKGIKSGKSLVPNKAMVWGSGATLTSPFGPTQSTVKSPRQTHHSSTPAMVVAPSLSVPPPRQLVTDLITSRPTGTTGKGDEGGNRELSGVPEVDEDDEDDGDRDSPRNTKASSRRLLPLSPSQSLKRQNPGSIEQETLRFLDKLDLKTLLAQPRPNVKSFLPQTANTLPVGGTQVTCAVDSRVEDDHRSARNWPSMPGVASLPAGTARKLSARRESGTNPQAPNVSRLAHMELTYGTTAVEPRKARKETFQRLANPISGHTSTLQALSPDQRKKREADMGDWVPPVVSPPLRKLSEKKTKHLIDRLSEAPSVYEAAVAASPLKSKRLAKGTKQLAPVVRLKSNQEEDRILSARSKPTKPSGGKPQTNGRGMDERKAKLKQKLAARSRTEGSAVSTSGLGATFLTQHEEGEAKLATRSSKNFATYSSPEGYIPKRPVIPPTVRPRASSSATETATPTARSRGGAQRPTITSRTKLKPENTKSKTQPAHKSSRSLGKALSPNSRVANRDASAKPSISTPSRSKRISSMPPSSGAAAVLLGAFQASDFGTKTPLKSTGPRGRASTQSTSISKAKSQTTEEPSTQETAKSPPLKTALPQIRKPAANAPRRSPAPTARRIHTVRPP